MAAILDGPLDQWNQFWKGYNQQPLHQSIVQIGNAVSDEKIFQRFPHRVLCKSLSADDGSHLGSLSDSSNGYNSEWSQPKNHFTKVWSQLAMQFQTRRFFIVFPIGSYVKTMFAAGGHLGWTLGPTDTILKGFGPNWPCSFRQEDFSFFFQ